MTLTPADLARLRAEAAKDGRSARRDYLAEYGVHPGPHWLGGTGPVPYGSHYTMNVIAGRLTAKASEEEATEIALTYRSAFAAEYLRCPIEH